MLTDVLPYLRCPACGGALSRRQRSVCCGRGHCFDLAGPGYVQLASGRLRHGGDSAAMVAAREAFLGAGGYEFLAAALATAAGPAGSGGLVVDVGGGTGYHLARVLDARPAAVGLVVDVSRPALRRAARAHPRAGAVRADVWQGLPVADGAASVLLDVFAPRHGAELRRVLAADGVLLVVTPTPAHLTELPRHLGTAAGVRLLRVDPEKPDRVAGTLGAGFRLVDESVHTAHWRLSRPLVRALVAMGPGAPHTDPAALSRAVAALPEPLPVTASVRLARYLPA